MMAFEEAILKGRTQLNELLAVVEGTEPDQAIHETEQTLWNGLPLDVILQLPEAQLAMPPPRRPRIPTEVLG